MRCPQCGSENCTEPDDIGDVTCITCGYVFDQDEGEDVKLWQLHTTNA
ncbi:unnamed protein product [marine sediment metagenome]|uniref:TFIIB-type domain-containing protein n=1 Tax=marine sediment metagenome TaxID=412755 RepID=X1N235_9ZZZZ